MTVELLTFLALVSFGGLIAVWGVYPLTMSALAAAVSRRRRPTPVNAGCPLVSVVIATRDTADATRSRVLDCLASAYEASSLEVVVAVDRRSAHDVGALADVPGNVTIVRGDEPGGKAATLNAGVRAARGEVLVFTDVWQRFEPAAVAKLVEALFVGDIGAVSGSLGLATGRGRRSLADLYWLFERWLRAREAVVHSCPGVTGAIWAMRRELWLPLPAQVINDDMYAPMRLVLRGRRIGFARDARAFELRRHQRDEEFARKVRTLTGVIQICAWMPGVLNPRRNPIWLQFVFHKLLRLLTPYFVAGIASWIAIRAAQVVASAELAPVVIAGVVGVAIGRFGRLWDAMTSAAMLQVAAVIGTVNGLRGRWNVWGSVLGRLE